MRAGARVWLMDIVTTNDGKIIQIPKARGGMGGRGMAVPPKSTSYSGSASKKAKKNEIFMKNDENIPSKKWQTASNVMMSCAQLEAAGA